MPEKDFEAQKTVNQKIEEMGTFTCSGCGTNLQTEDSSQIGFIPKTKIMKYVSAMEHEGF